MGLVIWLGLSPHAVEASNVDIRSAAQRTPKLLAVWTMQRSGTSNMVTSLGQHPCIISLCELQNPLGCKAAKDVYNVRERLGVTCKQNRADALPFLLKSHDLLCKEEMRAEDREICGDRCIVVFKVFEDWNFGNLSELVQHEDVATLSLERAVERLSEDCPHVIEEASEKFKKMKHRHGRWFELVKALHHNKTFLDVLFESITSDERSTRTYANIVNFAGLGVKAQGSEITDLRHVVKAQGSEITDLRHLIKAQGSEITDLRHLIKAQRSEITDLKHKVKAQGSEISEITDLRHLVKAQGSEIINLRHLVKAQGLCSTPKSLVVQLRPAVHIHRMASC
eukprot:gene26866-4473_t